ncbi:MAG: IS1380 family transposase, partial [Bacteroidaceae bacterium]|nr:IS1380 family transposase [Bacteroidaceae bacterium]
MAKVQQKSEKISAFGGIFFVLDKFGSILSSVIDSHLGLRSRLIGYQYSEIIRAVFSVFCCGGDCMEDLNLYLKDVLTERPHTRVPSADTVLRGIEELATEKMSNEEIQKKFYALACRYSINVGEENLTISISGLNENLGEALRLTEEVLHGAKADQD